MHTHDHGTDDSSRRIGLVLLAVFGVIVNGFAAWLHLTVGLCWMPALTGKTISGRTCHA